MSKIEKYAPGQFCWVDLNTKDYDGMARFYGELWGWTLETDTTPNGRYGIFLRDGAPVAGMGEMSAEMAAGGMPSVWNSYVAVDDCAAVVAKAKELGAEVLFDAYETPNGSGTLAFLKDPEGAVFALWQGADHSGSAVVNEPGSFSWNELGTWKVDEATKFYTALFGWTTEVTPGPTTVVVFHNEGRPNGHALQMTEEWEGIPPHWSVYFAVEDTDATVKQVEALGGKVHVPPTDIPPGRFSVIEDPGGATSYVIQLASPPE